MYRFKENDLVICKPNQANTNPDFDIYAVVVKADREHNELMLDLYQRQGRLHLESLSFRELELSDYEANGYYQSMTDSEVIAFRDGLTSLRMNPSAHDLYKDYMNETYDTVCEAADAIENEEMVMTNIGEIPKSDYEQYVLEQYGFSSQEEVNEEGIEIEYGDKARENVLQLEETCTITHPDGSTTVPSFDGLAGDYLTARGFKVGTDYLHQYGEHLDKFIEYNILGADAYTMSIEAVGKNDDMRTYLRIPVDELNALKNDHKAFGEVIREKYEEVHGREYIEKVKEDFDYYRSSFSFVLEVSRENCLRVKEENDIEAMKAILDAYNAKETLTISHCPFMAFYGCFDAGYKEYLDLGFKEYDQSRTAWEHKTFEQMANWAFYECDRALSEYTHAADSCFMHGITLGEANLDLKAKAIRNVKEFMSKLSIPVCIEPLIIDADYAACLHLNVPFRHYINKKDYIDYEIINSNVNEIDIGVTKGRDFEKESFSDIITIRKADFRNKMDMNFTKYLEIALREKQKTDIER